MLILCVRSAKMVDEALKQMSGRFDEIYGTEGRPSIAPERLLRALVLQMLYSVRSERMLMEQLEQSSVPLVRGAVSQRTGVASDSVYEAFLGRGWIEAWAGLRPAESAPAAAAYILVRMRNLQAAKV